MKVGDLVMYKDDGEIGFVVKKAPSHDDVVVWVCFPSVGIDGEYSEHELEVISESR